MYKKIKFFNDKLGEILALFLSSMGCFWIVFALVILPLFVEHPTTFIGWIQYIVQTLFQGVALPVLGYVGRAAGVVAERMAKETHEAVYLTRDTTLEELALIKNELSIARSEQEEIKQFHKELKQGMRAIRYGSKTNGSAR